MKFLELVGMLTLLAWTVAAVLLLLEGRGEYIYFYYYEPNFYIVVFEFILCLIGIVVGVKYVARIIRELII